MSLPPKLSLVANNPPLSERLASMVEDLDAFAGDGFEVSPDGVAIMRIELHQMAQEAAVLERAASPGIIRLAPGGLRRVRR